VTFPNRDDGKRGSAREKEKQVLGGKILKKSRERPQEGSYLKGKEKEHGRQCHAAESVKKEKGTRQTRGTARQRKLSESEQGNSMRSVGAMTWAPCTPRRVYTQGERRR